MAASTAYRAGRLVSWAVRGALVAVLALTAQITAPGRASAEQIGSSAVGENVILVGGGGYDARRGQHRRFNPNRGNDGYSTLHRGNRGYRGHRHYRPRHGWRDRRGYRHRNNGAAIGGAAIFGLATGAILGSALSGGGREYIDPPVRRGGYAPWTPEWYSYCSRKYRSFNPETGYFLAYSGKYRFCR